MTDRPQLLIIWFSRTGGSAAMARAAHAAARTAQGCDVRMLAAGEAGADDLLAAQGYLFVCPENLAAIAGGMKEFLDAAYYPVLGRIEGRPYAAMICAGSDGENARCQLERIAAGWRLKRVADTLIVCTHAQTPEAILAPKSIDAGALARCAEIGATLAEGLAMGVF